MKQYLLSIVAAALICGIVTKLMGDKGTQGAIGKLIAGLFLTFTVVSPLRDIRIGDLTTLTAPYTVAATAAAEEGQQRSFCAMSERIKQDCEAYILDKARQLDVALEISVSVEGDTVPVPCAIALRGNVSPNARRTLESIIEEDLGIPKEAQTWS